MIKGINLIDDKDVIEKTRKMLEFYISELGKKSCLADEEYDSITLDMVFCDSKKIRISAKVFL